jgi:outer membrane protein TolC
MVRLQQLEIIKADTDLRKEEGKYTPKVDFKAQNYQKTDKSLPSTIFSGTKISQNTYTAGVEKLFESGTFLRLEGSDTRFDSNAGEGPAALSNPLLSRLAQPPVHTGAVSVILQQELLKNAFGYSQKRLNEIARKQSMLKREQLEYQLTGLVVQTMINYWNLAIAEQEVTTAKLLLNNTRNIRDITAQKLNIGLAEGFELNQWNALVSSAEIQVAAAELNRDTLRRDLLRTLNLDPELKLTGATDLIKDMPSDINVERDIEHALQNRPDLKAIDKQLEIARLSTELADNNLLPTMRIGGKYSSRDWGRHATTAYNAVPDGSYPESAVEFYMQYPLWDEAAKVDARNARIALKQLTIQKAEITRQVRDEVMQGYDQIRVSFQALQKAQNALQQTEAFYFGLVNGYQRGRFTAVAVKNALDSLVQARQALTRASIQYNISLVRYDMVRNQIFKKYNIDINEVIYKMENRLGK